MSNSLRASVLRRSRFKHAANHGRITQRGNDLVNSHRVALLGLGRTPTSYIKQVRLLNFSWAVVGFLLLFCLAGCGTQHVELPTLPNTDSAASHRTQTVRSHPSSGTFDLLYITDRAPITASDSALSYGAERATFLSFGSVSIASTRKPLTSKSELRVSAVSQTGRFPATPYGVEATANGLSRSVEAVTAHDRRRIAAGRSRSSALNK